MSPVIWISQKRLDLCWCEDIRAWCLFDWSDQRNIMIWEVTNRKLSVRHFNVILRKLKWSLKDHFGFRRRLSTRGTSNGRTWFSSRLWTLIKLFVQLLYNFHLIFGEILQYLLQLFGSKHNYIWRWFCYWLAWRRLLNWLW